MGSKSNLKSKQLRKIVDIIRSIKLNNFNCFVQFSFFSSPVNCSGMNLCCYNVALRFQHPWVMLTVHSKYLSELCYDHIYFLFDMISGNWATAFSHVTSSRHKSFQQFFCCCLQSITNTMLESWLFYLKKYSTYCINNKTHSSQLCISYATCLIFLAGHSCNEHYVRQEFCI